VVQNSQTVGAHHKIATTTTGMQTARFDIDRWTSGGLVRHNTPVCGTPIEGRASVLASRGGHRVLDTAPRCRVNDLSERCSRAAEMHDPLPMSPNRRSKGSRGRGADTPVPPNGAADSPDGPRRRGGDGAAERVGQSAAAETRAML
jgi:hypothetical protein